MGPILTIPARTETLASQNNNRVNQVCTGMYGYIQQLINTSNHITAGVIDNVKDQINCLSLYYRISDHKNTIFFNRGILF